MASPTTANQRTQETYSQAIALLHDEQAVRAARVFAGGVEAARLAGSPLREWGVEGLRRCRDAGVAPVLLAMLPLLWQALLVEAGVAE